MTSKPIVLHVSAHELGGTHQAGLPQGRSMSSRGMVQAHICSIRFAQRRLPRFCGIVPDKPDDSKLIVHRTSRSSRGQLEEQFQTSRPSGPHESAVPSQWKISSSGVTTTEHARKINGCYHIGATNTWNKGGLLESGDQVGAAVGMPVGAIAPSRPSEYRTSSNPK